MKLGSGVTRDDVIRTYQPYLARVGKRYIVIYPWDGAGDRPVVPYGEAVYWDRELGVVGPLKQLNELAPIVTKS